MSRFKNNKPRLKNVTNSSHQQSWVERTNRQLSRLMGKKHHSTARAKTSNMVFGAMIVICLLLLWLSTGFYYLADDEFGVIISDGKADKVINGVDAGFTDPYPFGDIVAIDATVSDLIDLRQINNESADYVILSQDLHPINVDVKFNYQVINPLATFKHILAPNFDMDKFVAIIIQQQLRNYLVKQSSSNLNEANLTIVADAIKQSANAILSIDGIKVIKLNVFSLQLTDNKQAVCSESQDHGYGKACFAAESLSMQNYSNAAPVRDFGRDLTHRMRAVTTNTDFTDDNND